MGSRKAEPGKCLVLIVVSVHGTLKLGNRNFQFQAMNGYDIKFYNKTLDNYTKDI